MGRMTMRQPALRWQDALPAGNGMVGAMMHGRICDEQVLLNHEALWYRGAEKPRTADLADLLPELRDLLAKGEYREAHDFLQRHNERRGGRWRRRCEGGPRNSPGDMTPRRTPTAPPVCRSAALVRPRQI